MCEGGAQRQAPSLWACGQAKESVPPSAEFMGVNGNLRGTGA